MDAATTRRPWGYLGCCCAALALSACPQLLSDQFLLGRDPRAPDAGAGNGSAGQGGQGSGGAAGAGGRDTPDATAGTAGDAQAPLATCNDGLRNQDETGVDCGGGACSPCNCRFGPFHDIVQVEGLGTDDRYGPMLSADGTWLYYSVKTSSAVEDLFRATRSGTGTTFTGAESLAALNSPSSLEGNPFPSRDNLTLLFFSDRAGGVGNRDLWLATRTGANDDFSTPKLIAGVNSTAVDMHPRLSYDGLTLLFESARAGGSGNSDIWAAERTTPTGLFGTPYPREDLNTAGREEGFSLSGDQLTIVLSSNRGVDSMDLFLAQRSDPRADFGPLVPLAELNGTADELDPGLSLNGREIFFTTSRDGDQRIYHAVRDCQ